MEDIDQSTRFYLGREYDLETRTVLDRPVHYEARDLTTHGVVVGMTGSGKTGLCITLLEEAALDGIPCILVDPKGDLTNLLLQFPDLDPKDFLRWLNPEDARQKGLSLEEYAKQLAASWRQGLQDSGQPPERIARLRESAEWRVYTPGSEAGLPLSILGTFTAPKGTVTREALNQKIDATATALLGLTGIDADPVQSREHILLAQLLLHAWNAGRDIDLPQLIEQVQEPPLQKIGAFDVDTFYPEKDRLKLAVALNNILAAPSFSTWITGEALDLSRMLESDTDKPRQLIFYVAHLEDAQRVFFLTLLLEEVLSWTRKQPGTTSLRAILYFDEVFGYLPPHPANPPTKMPLMTLLKQARAFGVGILLATQNPVDLDYKALSNAGTWFVGKLQTERDKARLLEGLEGVAAERGTLTNRAYLETVISALGNRVFLLHDVHRGKPILFQSRWALSFLRGPMTRDQVAELMQPLKERLAMDAPPALSGDQEGRKFPPSAIPLCRQCGAELGPVSGQPCPKCGEQQPRLTARLQEREFKQGLRRTPAAPGSVAHGPPTLPADVPQYFLPPPGPEKSLTRAAGDTEKPAYILVYQPRLLGFAEVVFADRRKGLEHRRPYRYVVEPPPSGQPVNWPAAQNIGDTLASAPEANAHWLEVPEALNKGKKVKALGRDFADFLYGNARLVLLTNRALNLIGQPGEDVVAFKARCRAAAREVADRAVAAEKPKFTAKFEALKCPLPDHLPQSPAGEADKQESSWNPLAWLFVPLGGESKPAPVANHLSAKDKAKLSKLETDWRAKVAAIYEKWLRIGEDYAELLLAPRKADIRVTHFGLAWVPAWQVPGDAVESGKGPVVP